MLISNFVDSLYGYAVDIIVLSLLGVLVVSFVTILIIELVYGRTNAFVYCYNGIVLGATVIIFSSCITAFYPVMAQTLFWSCLSMGIGALFSSVLFLLPKKERKAIKEEKKLIKLIDDEINKEKNSQLIIPSAIKEYATKPEVLSPKPMSSPIKKDKKEIDFSHVWNVISRLDYVPLNVSEKRQVDALKKNVARAENGDTTVKNEINDGLGALLKIMSKYSA